MKKLFDIFAIVVMSPFILAMHLATVLIIVLAGFFVVAGVVVNDILQSFVNYGLEGNKIYAGRQVPLLSTIAFDLAKKHREAEEE